MHRRKENSSKCATFSCEICGKKVVAISIHWAKVHPWILHQTQWRYRCRWFLSLLQWSQVPILCENPDYSQSTPDVDCPRTRPHPANDISKHMKVATAEKVKKVIAEAPIGNALFLESELHSFRLSNFTGIRAAHLHQELNRSSETALSPTKLWGRALQKVVREESKCKLEETSGLQVKENTYSALCQTMQHHMLDDLIHNHNHDLAR